MSNRIKVIKIICITLWRNKDNKQVCKTEELIWCLLGDSQPCFNIWCFFGIRVFIYLYLYLIISEGDTIYSSRTWWTNIVVLYKILIQYIQYFVFTDNLKTWIKFSSRKRELAVFTVVVYSGRWIYILHSRIHAQYYDIKSN